MPSARTAHNDYYSRHHRRTSSHSQTSLPDHIRASTTTPRPPYSPSRSAVFLPATTYSHNAAPRPDSPQTPRDVPRLNINHSSAPYNNLEAEQRSANPDDYYRDFRDSYVAVDQGQPSLHQGALHSMGLEEEESYRSTTRTNVISNWPVDDDDNRVRRGSASNANLSGLRQRKTSVKNLVAQFNASSSDDTPPLPQTTFSRPSSRTASPLPSATSGPTSGKRRQSSTAIPSKHKYSISGLPQRSDVSQQHHNRRQDNINSSSKRPLFGEVLTETTSIPAPGYGIVNPRRRGGSDSSPMHSPNPMFPQDSQDDAVLLTSAVYKPESSIPQFHRRSNSEVASNRPLFSRSHAPISPTGETNGVSISRIPLSSHRLSNASASESSSPAHSRAPSAQNKQSQRRSQQQPMAEPQLTDAKASTQKTDYNSSKITSPGRRGKTAVIQHGQKSPSLRANIIVPPSKTPPQLRRSPRLPVTTASTAASRAKMAEKFNTMHKKNADKKGIATKPLRPPELTDIDLKARRMRITQALSKSREGLNLANESKNAKRDFTASSHNTDVSLASNQSGSRLSDMSIPQLSVEHAGDGMAFAESEQHIDREPIDRDAIHHSRPSRADDDSPTLGIEPRHFDRPTPLTTQFLTSNFGHDEPYSALTDVTVETEATNIDPEPQTDEPEYRSSSMSLLNHVMQMRDVSPNSAFTASPLSNPRASDHGDVESVHLILRDTAYLDDDEAIEKGYRQNAALQDSMPNVYDSKTSDRDSWTSAMEDEPLDPADRENEANSRAQTPNLRNQNNILNDSQFMARSDINRRTQTESVRDTMASDAYTIVNIVLQQHANSGIVDQQFLDDVWHRVIEAEPYFEDEGIVDAERIEKMCLQEIEQRDNADKELSRTDTLPLHQQNQLASSHENLFVEYDNHNTSTVGRKATVAEFGMRRMPPSSYRAQVHRHKSSLDSAEDWADTSPSVGDWMRFARDEDTSDEEINAPQHVGLQESEEQISRRFLDDDDQNQTDPSEMRPPKHSLYRDISDVDPESLMPEDFGTAIIRRSSHSPPSPPPPPPKPFANEQGLPVSRSGTPASINIHMPAVPDRSASLGQAETSQTQNQLQQQQMQNKTEVVPSDVQDAASLPTDPEARRMRQRKFVLKEIVVTEFTYARDMRVLSDIYKQTAQAALSEDDIRILFGNVDDIQEFAMNFSRELKQTVKPVYTMDKVESRAQKLDDFLSGPLRANSSSSTLASAKFDGIPDAAKDNETRVGHIFEENLAKMEQVYTEYIRNRHAANQKLESLEKSAGARDWLKECKDNSSDITNAWNLDALLVKPVQRITKYPLLLKQLIDSTQESHSDMITLKRALSSVTEINVRINEVKKHAELVDQVLNRKRGQSDVRTGLSKAFGRRAEKLKQHVGIADMYEDGEYNEIRIDYDNNIVQLMVVANDCLSYEKGMTQWVNKMVEIAATAESWVDAAHSHHPQLESKLRQLAMIIRGVSTIALPDHLEHLQKHIILPMQKAVDILTKFRDDPKGLLHKRDKRLVDYAQMRNKKDRGEKIDRKTAERMDQWEALNTEAKERMRKLRKATTHLVQSILGKLVQLQMTWMAMLQQKFSTAMGLPMNRLEVHQIEKDWQDEFSFPEAMAQSLGLCNGSLLLEAANMLNFLTPGSTLNGNDSPRQPSRNSNNNRSISLNSEGSTVPTLESLSRPSATFSEGHFDRPYPYAHGRIRAASAASGSPARLFDASPLPSAAMHSSAAAHFNRPGTSPGISQEPFTPPRLSIDTPSPHLGFADAGQNIERPASSNTFFSVDGAPGPSYHGHHHSSSIFSSALPMSDSPVQERNLGIEATDDPKVLFTAASIYEFNIDKARREANFPYLTYVSGEIFDVIGERGELWLARNQDDPDKQIGWIWNKHFAKLAE